MIPLRDHNPSGRIPIITYFLLAINILVFIWMFMMTAADLENFIANYALIPALVTSGQRFFSFFSSIFLHGGIAHILGNMLFLNIFGDNLEDFFGHFKFLVFYLLGGVAASLLQVIINPGSAIPVLGASGAIAATMGGYLVLFPRHRIDVLFSFGWVVRQASVPAYTMLFYWFIFQIFSGVGSLAYMSETMGGVAYFAHVGGFVFGWVVTKLLARKKARV
jgi:membrane associated rhomboid family serine protease